MSEEEEDSVPLQTQVPSPPASTLPPYPELIIAAIDALNDPNGSNKTTISRHIESLYPNLPSSDTTLLTQHLNQIKENVDLVMDKNNYMRPDQDAPPKRGRGRPRKDSEPTIPGQLAPSSSPKPRGRPPKSRYSESTRNPKPSVSGKKRGLPRKDKGAEPEVVASPASAGEGVGRRRRKQSLRQFRWVPKGDEVAGLGSAEIVL